MSKPINYFLITISNQPDLHEQRSVDVLMRAIEDYLIKSNIDYNIESYSRKVFVKDKVTAIRIGSELQLKSIQYFNGITLSTIPLGKSDSVKRKQTVYVEARDSGSTKTLKEFKAEKKVRAKTEGITKSEIISYKLATRAGLETLILKYNLPVTKFGGKLYLNQVDFAKALQSES